MYFFFKTLGWLWYLDTERTIHLATIFHADRIHLRRFQLQISKHSSSWSLNCIFVQCLDGTDANCKQIGHVLCIKSLTHFFKPNRASSVTLALCFQAESSTLLLLCSHTLAMVLSSPLIIHWLACLSPHTETHAIHCKHIRDRGYGTLIHSRKGEGEGF